MRFLCSKTNVPTHYRTKHIPNDDDDDISQIHFTQDLSFKLKEIMSTFSVGSQALMGVPVIDHVIL
jgi:hypothetical protein